MHSTAHTHSSMTCKMVRKRQPEYMYAIPMNERSDVQTMFVRKLIQIISSEEEQYAAMKQKTERKELKKQHDTYCCFYAFCVSR